MPKYRKIKYSKSYKFGDFLGDYGKLMLNNLAAPIEQVSGRQIYEPEFKTQVGAKASDITAGLIGMGTDIAGTMAIGPGYTTGKQAIQSSVNAIDPQEDPQRPMSYKQGGSMLAHVGGNTHDEGGVGVDGYNAEVQKDETIKQDSKYVFSNDIIIDRDIAEEFGLKNAEGKSFAKYSKFIEKSDNGSDLDKKTTQAMLDRLEAAQESYKKAMFEESVDLTMKMRMGGSLYRSYTGRKKFLLGGPAGMQPAQKTLEEGQSGKEEDPTKKSAEQVSEEYGQYENPGVNPYLTAMQAAPMVANFISALDHDRLNPERYTVREKVRPYFMNVDPQIKQVNDSFVNTVDAAKGAVPGSGGAYLATLASIGRQKNDATHQILTGKYNADNQAVMQAQMANMQNSQFNTQSLFRTDDWNMKSSEAAKNMARAGTTEMSKLGDHLAIQAFWDNYNAQSAPDFYTSREMVRRRKQAERQAAREAERQEQNQTKK